jgi:hypothetical protein
MRAASESARFDFKQGVKGLDGRSTVNRELLTRLVQTAYAISNVTRILVE